MTGQAMTEISADRAALLDHYGELFGIVDPRSLPGLARKTNGWLAEKLGMLQGLQGKIRRARVEGGIERLRTRQAAVTASVDVCRDWLRGAFDSWETEKSAKVFDPFHAAVELYGNPASGLYFAAERIEEPQREVFKAAVKVIADQPATGRHGVRDVKALVGKPLTVPITVALQSPSVLSTSREFDLLRTKQREFANSENALPDHDRHRLGALQSV